MAKLKAKINKDEYAELGDVLHEFYTETADGEYVLEADGVEDVTGLKSALERERAAVRDAKKVLKQFEGLNADEARKALSETSQREEKDLIDQKKFEEVLKKYKADFDADLSREKEKNNQILTNLKREKLTNMLIKNGVLPDRAKFALVEIDNQVELHSDENGIHLQKTGGIGDAKELDEMVTGLRENSAFLFAPTNASGSGAAASNANGGSGSGQKVEPGLPRITQALNTALPQ